MGQSYQAKVNDTYTFLFSSDDITSSDIIQSETGYHIIEDDKSFIAEIVQADFYRKTYTVNINGNFYIVNISDELDLLITELGLEATTEKKEHNIKAPMPGLIVSINVEVGQTVTESDGILVLEAMKMENMLTAPRDGIIKSIAVKEGDTVDKNTLLIEME